jgi:hypothetical protein
MPSRPSPTESANDNEYILKYGNDNNLWVSMPNKNFIYHWVKLNKLDILKSLYDKISIKDKNDYIPFLNFYKKFKYNRTLFYYHTGFLYHHLTFILEDNEDININDSETYRDYEGAFYKYDDNENFSAKYVIKNLFLNNQDIDYIFIFTDLDLLYSIFNHEISIIGFNRSQIFDNVNTGFPNNYYENITNLFNKQFNAKNNSKNFDITIYYNKSKTKSKTKSKNKSKNKSKTKSKTKLKTKLKTKSKTKSKTKLKTKSKK